MISSTQYILCELTKNLLEAPELPSTHPIVKKAAQINSQNAEARQQLAALSAAQFLEDSSNATTNLRQLRETQDDESASQQSALFAKKLEQQKEHISKLNLTSDSLHTRYRQLSDQVVQGLKDLVKHVTGGPKNMEKSQFVSKELQRYNREQKSFSSDVAKHKQQCNIAQEQLVLLNKQIFSSLPPEQRGMAAAPISHETRQRG